jgi:hypothetical protein
VRRLTGGRAGPRRWVGDFGGGDAIRATGPGCPGSAPWGRRCRALGATIRQAVEEAPGAQRVAAVASGSFSLEIGGPRISDHSHTGVPDPEWADRIMARMRAGELDDLVAEASEEQLTRAVTPQANC